MTSAGSQRFPKSELRVTLPVAVHRLLQQAAARRLKGHIGMTDAELAAQLLGGILTRGSIDRTLALWGEYTSDRRTIGNDRVFARRELRRQAESYFRE